MMRPLLAVLAMLTGCAAAQEPQPELATLPVDPEPAGPPAPPAPHKAAPARPLLTGQSDATEAPAAAIARDSAALRDQAASYVGGKFSETRVIDQLTVLTMRSNAALDKMEANKAGKVYRLDDIAEARAAADALAAFIHSRAKTP